MPSRMDRYTSAKKTRADKNKELYSQIYDDKEYTNVEAVVKAPVTGNINIERIKEIINNHEEVNKSREARFREIPKPKEVVEEDEEIKSYDIKDVLNKAKDERKDENTNYHNLKDIETNILKNLNIQKPEEKSELTDLINTITNTSLLNKINDQDLSLDLLDDLKSTDNTVIGSSDAIRNVLKEEKKEIEEEMDDSFNTKSMDLESELENLKGQNGNKTNKILTRIFLIIIIIVVIIVGFILVSKLLKK